MRYLEYVYLLLALGVAAGLALQFGSLPVVVQGIMIFMVSLFAFLFSFRRQQRLFQEKKEREALEREQAANETSAP